MNIGLFEGRFKNELHEFAEIKKDPKSDVSIVNLFLSLNSYVVVSNIFYFHPYLGKIPILTNIFQMG